MSQPVEPPTATLLRLANGYQISQEWKAILAAGGFDLSSIAPTASRFQILEGRPSV